MKLSPWIDIGHCATRVVLGQNPDIVAYRMAFIEKSPRVRILSEGYAIENSKDVVFKNVSHCSPGIDNIWIFGSKGDGHLCGKDTNSRKWCDAMLILLGYELTN